jgi:hypothetical protein
MVGAATEKKAILHSKHSELIYSQSGTLYDIILNSPRLSTNPRKKNKGPHGDGVVGFFSHATVH